MTENDRRRFAAAMNALSAIHRVEASEPLLEGYWLGLQDLPISAVEKAIARSIATSKRMPVPADLRELSGDIPAATRAVKAWAKVKDSIRRIGAYSSVNFDDPITNATIRALGGWTRLCSTDSEELDKWTRKDFERIYSALSNGGVSSDEGKYLAGIHEAQGNGFGDVAPPVQIATGVGKEKPSLEAMPDVPRLIKSNGGTA